MLLSAASLNYNLITSKVAYEQNVNEFNCMDTLKNLYYTFIRLILIPTN